MTPKIRAAIGSTSKYGNVFTEADGIKFRSKREALRYRELTLMESAGQIRDLRLQVRYPLKVNGVTVGVYVADFVYRTPNAEADTVEDVKGKKTALYVIKSKLMLACYGVRIFET